MKIQRSRLLPRSAGGFTLAPVLMIISMVLLVSMCMAGISCFQLNLAMKVYNDARARMAAESELNRALFCFVDESNTFGKDGNPDKWSDPYTGSSARITFTQGGAIPHSTYNYNNIKDVLGWNGKKVPRESIHLIATGTSGSSRRSIEMIVKKGIFPFALATSSKIQSVNAPLWTEGVNDTKSLLADVKDRPGNVNSNYSSSGNAIEAPKNSFVTGAVTAPGEIDIKKPSIIIGGIKPGSPTIELPFITTGSLDPKDQIGAIDITSASLSGMKMDSLHRSTGKLTIYGNLELDNAVLFTEGDLLVTGKVIGSGALISRGAITLQQTSDLTADNQVAIVADKDVTIAGQNSYLQGMVYTHGNFYGENFTLVGNLIAQSSDESKGQAVLNNVKLISSDAAAEQIVTTPAYAGEAGGNLWQNTKVEYELNEHFDIRLDSSNLKNSDISGLINALNEASNDFNATTASALDQYANLTFYIVCNNTAQDFFRQRASNMEELYTNIMTSPGPGPDKYVDYINAINSAGDTLIPPSAKLDKIIKGLLKHLRHNLDVVGPGNGEISGFTVMTDLRLNKYITNARPTRITFQGELP
ncbi:MAG: hypothetical protein AB9903_06180 [Vulcanimicrobiota bacterium]